MYSELLLMRRNKRSSILPLATKVGKFINIGRKTDYVSCVSLEKWKMSQHFFSVLYWT